MCHTKLIYKVSWLLMDHFTCIIFSDLGTPSVSTPSILSRRHQKLTCTNTLNTRPLARLADRGRVVDNTEYKARDSKQQLWSDRILPGSKYDNSDRYRAGLSRSHSLSEPSGGRMSRLRSYRDNNDNIHHALEKTN